MQESVSLFSPASRDHVRSLIRGPFLCLWSQQHSIFKSLSDSGLLSPSSTFKRPLWLHWIIQDNLSSSQLISNFNSLCNLSSPLPCNNMLTGLGDYGMDIFGGPLFAPQGFSNVWGDLTRLPVLEVPELYHLSPELARHDNRNSKPPGFLEMPSDKCWFWFLLSS